MNSQTSRANQMNAKYNPDFIILPFDILQDDRLTLRQIRVLMAILSWRKKNTNVSAISREMIAKRTGYQLSRISAITTELEELGWIKKEGNGGRSKWIRYQICEVNLNQNQDLNDIETVPELETVTDSETVTDLNLNGTRFGIETVPESGTRIDTDKEQKEIQRDSAQKIERTHHHEANASENPKTESSAKPKRNSSRAKRPMVTLQTFLDNCEANGESFIRDYHPVWEYAQSIGLPDDMVVLACEEFIRKFTEEEQGKKKKYADWRLSFKNYVAKGWLGLWFANANGSYKLTTAGVQQARYFKMHDLLLECEPC